MTLAWTVLFYAAVIVVTYFLMIQVRRPSRYVGRIFTTIMNRSHSPLTDWGLSFVTIAAESTMLDIGCGGGRTVRKLADLAPAGRIYGVDPGRGSVEASRTHNRDLLDTRVQIDEGSVSALPYEDNFFDLLTAIETQYYWPQPVDDLREVLRVLKPGGKLVIILESYRGGSAEWFQMPGRLILGYRTYSPDQHRQMLADAGFVNIETHENKKHGWLAITGQADIVN